MKVGSANAMFRKLNDAERTHSYHKVLPAEYSVKLRKEDKRILYELCIGYRPAEAEKFKLEKLAEAHRLKTVLEAEAEAEAVKVRGEVSILYFF